MNKKLSNERDNFIFLLRQLKNEITEKDTLLLVEGKNDKAFFNYLGFDSDKILEISHLSEENLLINMKKIIEGESVVCIPLVDFDSEGIKYLKKISNLGSIKSSSSYTFKKLKVDTYFRHKLSSILMGKYREIEDIIYFLDKLQITQDDI